MRKVYASIYFITRNLEISEPASKRTACQSGKASINAVLLQFSTRLAKMDLIRTSSTPGSISSQKQYHSPRLLVHEGGVLWVVHVCLDELSEFLWTLGLCLEEPIILCQLPRGIDDCLGHVQRDFPGRFSNTDGTLQRCFV